MAGQPKTRAKAKTAAQVAADKNGDELRKKIEQAQEMNRYSPAVIHVGNGEVKTLTDEEIAAMTATECDAVIANIIQRRRVGNVARYPNIESLERKINEYWIFVLEERSKGHDVIPDVEHFASFLGVSRYTLIEWKRNNKNGFSDPLEMAFNDIAAVKNQLVMHGELNPMTWVAMMNNNHGYTQNNKLEISTKGGSGIPSASELLTEIDKLMDEDE